MSLQEVTGWTFEKHNENLKEYRETGRNEKRPYEEQYCLARIPRQPDDYDGPQRFCASQETKNGFRCPCHGGHAGQHENLYPQGTPETLDELANMKHGIVAKPDNLERDFSEKDQALYNWIVDSFAEAYDLDTDGDPLLDLKLHQYAREIVRNERGEKYLIEEGERHEEKKFSEDGTLIINEDGQVEMEYSEHYLAGMIRRHHNLLMDLEDSLGISLKARREEETSDSAGELMEALGESLGGLIEDGETQYDPEQFDPE